MGGLPTASRRLWLGDGRTHGKEAAPKQRFAGCRASKVALRPAKKWPTGACRGPGFERADREEPTSAKEDQGSRMRRPPGLKLKAVPAANARVRQSTYATHFEPLSPCRARRTVKEQRPPAGGADTTASASLTFEELGGKAISENAPGTISACLMLAESLIHLATWVDVGGKWPASLYPSAACNRFVETEESCLRTYSPSFFRVGQHLSAIVFIRRHLFRRVRFVAGRVGGHPRAKTTTGR